MTKEELCRRVAELENVDLFIVDEMAYTGNLNDALRVLAKYRGEVVGSLFGENEILVLDEGTRNWKFWRAFNYNKPEISLKEYRDSKFFGFFGSETIIKDVSFHEFVAFVLHDSRITAHLGNNSSVHHYALDSDSELHVVNGVVTLPSYLSFAMEGMGSKLTFRSNTAPDKEFRLDIEIATHLNTVDIDLMKFRKGVVDLTMHGGCKGCRININARYPYKSVKLGINGGNEMFEDNEIIINGIRQYEQRENNTGTLTG